MAQCNPEAQLSDRTHRDVENDLQMAAGGQERVAYAECQLAKQLRALIQQSVWCYQKLTTGTLREREAAEKLTEIEDAADGLSMTGTMLAQGARDRDVHYNDAIDRGLERSVDETPPSVTDSFTETVTEDTDG